MTDYYTSLVDDAAFIRLAEQYFYGTAQELVGRVIALESENHPGFRESALPLADWAQHFGRKSIVDDAFDTFEDRMAVLVGIGTRSIEHFQIVAVRALDEVCSRTGGKDVYFHRLMTNLLRSLNECEHLEGLMSDNLDWPA